MFKALFILLIVVAVAEFITTAYGLLSGKATEVNPFLRWLVKKLGINKMLIIKLVGTALIFLGVWLSQSVFVAIILVIPIAIACGWNVRALLKGE